MWTAPQPISTVCYFYCTAPFIALAIFWMHKALNQNPALSHLCHETQPRCALPLPTTFTATADRAAPILGGRAGDPSGSFDRPKNPINTRDSMCRIPWFNAWPQREPFFNQSKAPKEPVEL